MKATAIAPSNIAFIKYWGKKSERLRLPLNSSISMNLSEAKTTTSVEFRKKLRRDLVYINGKENEKERGRVVKHLNLIRKKAGESFFAVVKSKNSFPKSSGIASSASGFAALTLAATRALKMSLSEKELSILARMGSGSAARSIPDGFVEWKSASMSNKSYAHCLYPPDYWSLRDFVVVLSKDEKKVSSTKGHSLVGTSPFFESRIRGMNQKIKELKKSIKDKDFTKFGEIVEKEAINMHAVMMTSKPPLYYWEPETITLIKDVVDFRKNGLECYFTIDAGPNVHLIVQSGDAGRLSGRLKKLSYIKNIIVNKPAKGAYIKK